MDVPPSPLPEGLELMPPGPLLGEVLASVCLAGLAGEDTVTCLQAEYRFTPPTMDDDIYHEPPF